ncbi:chitobiase/beta-hexosaminidase C-terminal domain-containing protein [Nibricoccus sp. IMCC34717]|uniref:chitobiase/beta-hexosaminidase C-terminal domain-containing protein n=1 Tax=Nibricoccus sp. IMCC34717 TaxID=3034021 RepID=UPI00384BF039
MPPCPFTRVASSWSRSCIALAAAFAAVTAVASEIKEVLPLTNKIVVVHFDDGSVRHHRAGESRENEWFVNRSPLNTAAATTPGSWSLTSSDDSAYTAATAPASVGRKSKGTDWLITWPTPPLGEDAAFEHWLYLELPQPLVSGKNYTLNTGSLATNGSSWSFTFDEKQLRSDAIHVNQLGYAPVSPAKFGYLYHWMGDKGGLDLAAWEGKPFQLVRTSDSSVAFTGTIAFRGSKTASEGAFLNAITPNGNVSQADVYECDFTSFTTPGEYRLVVPGIGASYAFKVNANVYREAFYWVMKAIYHRRSGVAIDSTFGEFTRPAPHNPLLTPGFRGQLKYTTFKALDFSDGDGHNGGVKEKIEAGLKGDLNTWGWYQDAGDWDGYFTHTRVPYDLLTLFELAPTNFTDGELNIPESGNGLPDILDEASWLLRFYQRTRQEILAKGWGTGGVAGARVYGDLWGGDSAPDGKARPSWQDTTRMWVVTGEEVTASYRYAGLAAQFAYILQTLGKTDPLGVDWAKEAKDTFAWAQANVTASDFTKQNGGAFDVRLNRLFAAGMLYRLTGDAAYHTQYVSDYPLRTWSSYSFGADQDMPAVAGLLASRIRSFDATTLTALRNASRGCMTFELGETPMIKRPARWGGDFWFPPLVGEATTPMISASTSAYAIYQLEEPGVATDFLKSIYTTADFFLGNNPLNYVWVSGVGKNHPTQLFYMDWWYSDGAEKTFKGWVPYGPWAAVGQFAVDFGFGSYDYRRGHFSAYPDGAQWPFHEEWFEHRSAPITAENTIHQNQSPSAFVYGFLSGQAPALGQIAAAVPVFEPVGGAWENSVTVGIKSPLAGASIRYTLDGSTPTAATGTVYSGPVKLTQSKTVKAVAYKTGFNTSAVASTSFTIVPRSTYGNSGAPWTIGNVQTRRIQGEHFDSAGEGYSYHDTDAANLGGQLRTSEGVDIYTTADAGGGYAVRAKAGEWIEYTALVAKAGNHNVRFRVANGTGATQSVRLLVNGNDVTGPIRIPATAGVDAFLTAQKTDVALPAGKAVLRIVFDGDLSLNWFEVATAYSQTKASAPAFSVPGGAKSGPISLALSSTTAAATIRYTLDGSEPSNLIGTVYSGPISITNSATVKAIAYASGNGDSAVASADYKIDRGLPFVFNPVADRDNYADNPGNSKWLNTSLWNVAYLRFDLATRPNATLVGATLRFYRSSSDQGALTFNVSQSGNVWSENDASTLPARGALIGSVASAAAGWIELDVTDFVKAGISPEGLISFAVDSNKGGWTGFESRENNNQPQLQLFYGPDGPQGGQKYNFESSTQGWGIGWIGEATGDSSASVEVSSEVPAFQGSKVLKINADVKKAGTNDIALSVGLLDAQEFAGKTIKFRIWIPASAPTWGLLPYTQYNNDWSGWWSPGWVGKSNPGGWQEFTVNVPNEAVIKRVGFMVILYGDYKGPFYIDAIGE